MKDNNNLSKYIQNHFQGKLNFFQTYIINGVIYGGLLYISLFLTMQLLNENNLLNKELYDHISIGAIFFSGLIYLFWYLVGVWKFSNNVKKFKFLSTIVKLIISIILFISLYLLSTDFYKNKSIKPTVKNIETIIKNNKLPFETKDMKKIFNEINIELLISSFNSMMSNSK
jgi:hypothetical protein